VIFEECNCGIPVSADGIAIDEGIKFLDWNNDGRLDLIIHDPNRGPQLYQNIGTRTTPEFQRMSTRSDGLGPMFAERITGPSGSAYEPLPYCESYGMNVYDFDNNGLEDVIVAGSSTSSPGCNYPNVVFRNTGAGFESVSAGGISDWPAGGVFAFGDINQDGKIDAVYMGPSPFYFVNASNSTSGSFTVEVLGAKGEPDQHGRVVRVSLPKAGCTAEDQPGCTLTRVVDSGSGYHSQNQYPILIGTPYAGSHQVEIVFPDPTSPGNTVAVSASVNPGQYARVFAPSMKNPNGRVTLYAHPPKAAMCRAS
jgi:hypothetical protein